MAKFYATIQGSRDPKTCTGTDNIKACAQSYDGSVITRLIYIKDKLNVNICTNDHSDTYGDDYDSDICCTFDQFKDLLKLYNDIKDDKVSLVRHRTKKDVE